MGEIDKDELRKWLRPGELDELAAKFGVSVRTAYYVMAGKVNNLDFLEVVVHRALENKLRIMEPYSKMKSLNPTA